MKVILTSDVKNIGQKGDEKDVKPGFARNFLLPNGLAVLSDSKDALELKAKKESDTAKEKLESEKIKQIISKNDNLVLGFEGKASPEGKLFGSIKTKEIVNKAEELLGTPVLSINPNEAIKSVGEHKITLAFKSGNSLLITVNVKSQK